MKNYRKTMQPCGGTKKSKKTKTGKSKGKGK